MGGEWRDTTLGDVLTLQRGFDLPSTERKPGPYPVIASTGQVGTHEEAIAKGPGVAIGRSGSIGGGQFIKGDFWPLNTTLWVKDFRGNDRRFCYYLLRSLDFAGYNVGSGVPTLNRNHIHPLPVCIPTDSEDQHAIANILGSFDDKIELNRRMNRALEAVARAIFKAWFIDFEPVKAKAAGATSFPGMPQPVFDELSDQFIETELGPIPKGWDVGALGDVVEIHDKRRVPLSKKQRGMRRGRYPYYGATGIIDYVDDFLFEGVHVLLGEDGSVIDDNGRPFVQYVWGSYWVNNHAHVLKGANGFSDEQLYLFLKQVNVRPFVTGAVQPKLNQRNVKAIPLAVPSESLCNGFFDLVKPLFALLVNNSDGNLILAAMRDALLPKLISGEIRVGASAGSSAGARGAPPEQTGRGVDGS